MDPPARCLVFITDVSLVTRREQYLRDQQNSRYDAVVATSPDVIFTVDGDGLIQFANPAAVAKFGFSAEELTGRDASTLFETAAEWRDIWRGAMTGSPNAYPRELIACLKDGSSSYLEASASHWKSGSRIFVTVILRDIDERRAIDAALT